jgi:hypothetical protein
MNDATNTPAVIVTFQQGEVVAVDPLVVTTKKYTVPEENLPELTAKIEKLSRRATKLGLPVISFSKVSELDVPFLRSQVGDEAPRYKKLETAEDMAKAKQAIKWDEERHGSSFSSIVLRKYVVIELTGAVPRLAGWDFVATLQHLEMDGEIANMLRIVPGFEGTLPLKFRDCGPENCDHCKKTIRTRKETFVVRNTTTGEWLQVGRNCTQDFLGGKDPHAVAAMLEMMQRAGEMLGGAEEEGMGWGGGYIADRGPMVDFLEWVAACVRIDGWISRGKARSFDGQVVATADQAWSYMFPPMIRDPKAAAKFREARRAHTPTEEDKTTAANALEYAEGDLKGKTEGNDYLYNLWVACNQTAISSKLSGISASLISHFIKEVERRALKEMELRSTKDSVHVGAVGERRFFKVKVLSTKVVGLESQFGPKTLTKMADESGNMIVWFDSTPEPLKTGQDYILKATVKNHDEYQGVKQTIINRAEPVTQEQMDADLAKLAKKAERVAKKAAKGQS